MKKKIISIFACSLLLLGGGLFVRESLRSSKVEQTKAATDVGEITISEVRNAISTSTVLYLLPTAESGLPDSWDYPYTAVGEEDGVFINGVKQVGAVIKHAGTGSAFTTFYYGMPAAPSDNDVVEFKGEFATTSNGGWSFSIHYATQWFASQWVPALEEYDLVSLADANMPDIAAGATINTDDMGGDYTYVTDAAALPQKKGFFGLTNDTGSYAFQFNHKKTSTGTGWFHVLIGGQGPLWNAGHFIDFGFLDSWADTGHAIIKEMTGKGNNWEGEQVQATDVIALGWNVGETNLLEMGLIKVQGSSQYFVFFKVNGVLKFGECWTLAEGGMTTKITMQYAGTDTTITNSINYSKTKLHTSGGTATAINLYTNNDICAPLHNWDDYFKSADQLGLKLNGTVFGNDHWNYFKKTAATGFFLDLNNAGAGTITAGDILYIGGLFRSAKEVNGVKVLYKAAFENSYFEFDGESWNEVDPDYSSIDFSKDLLKLTSGLCNSSYDGVTNNHDALATIWTTLGGANYYGKLTSARKTELTIAEAADVTVPATESGIDGMTDENALAAAMYRYEYCVAKYNLTQFIVGKTVVVQGTGVDMFAQNNSSNITILVIVITSISLLAVAGLCFYKKKKYN